MDVDFHGRRSSVEQGRVPVASLDLGSEGAL